jgi:hypothetical protein
MSLHGPFEVLDFSEILRLLASKGETGRLEVFAAGVVARLYLASGRLTWAEVEERHPTVPSETGPDDPLVDACARFVHCDRGSFDFEPGAKSPSGSYVEAEVERTLALARLRAAEWREVAVVVPSLEVHPSLMPDVADEPVILTRDMWRLVTAINGRRSVSALARMTGLSTFAVCRLLKRLIDGGAVTVNDQPKAAIEASQIEEAADQAEEGLIKIIFDRPDVEVEGREADEENGSRSDAMADPEKGAETDGEPRRERRAPGERSAGKG